MGPSRPGEFSSTPCLLRASGTKHKTILEARSGLGPIKAYPRLGPPAPGEPEAPAQDRTFHCEICNVKVNSEVQLKQVGLRPSPRILWRAPAKGEERRELG